MLGSANQSERAVGVTKRNSAVSHALGSVPVRPLYSTTLTRLVALSGFAVALAVAGATAGALWVGRQESLNAAESATSSLARPLTDSVARSFLAVDVTLASVADLAREAGLDHGPIDLSRQVSQRLLLTPYLRQVVVVKADGSVLFDSAGQITGSNLAIAEVVAEHVRLPRPLVIGVPVAGRFVGVGGKSAGQSLIPVSHAMTDSGGKVVALVVAALNPDHFRGGFEAIEGETGARVSLWRFDGVRLASAGQERMDIPWGGRAEGLPLFTRYLRDAEMGTFTAQDEDGVTRITSYRTTLAWPLVISVGLPEDAALANWRRNARLVGWPVAMVTLVVLGLTSLLAGMLLRRARDEAALRLSDRVLANVSDGVSIADALDPDLSLLYVNPAFERITGYPAAGVLGRNARFLHADDTDQEELNDVRDALVAGRPVTVKLRNRRADGGRFWNRLSLTPVHGPGGLITHWVGVQRDITQDETSFTALAKAYDEVERYSEDLERFSFVLAHHLQEPARQMRLQAQVLLQSLGDESDNVEREPAILIVEAAARQIDLLRDVQVYLEVDRQSVESGRGRSEFALNAAINRFSSRLPDGQLVVERGVLPPVGISQKRLDDLFEILVENALVFRHPARSPSLSVGAELCEGRWRFQVADNGVGIEPRYFERIFIPLERLHDRSSHPGTGIGLAVARKIVEAAGGRIWVESDGASGSTFFFTLPVGE